MKDRAHKSLIRAAHNLAVIIRFAAFLSLLALVAGCGYGDDEDEGAPRSDAPAQAVPRVPSPEDGTGRLPVDDFNEFVEEARPAFATSALRTALEFANAGEGQSALTSVEAREGPEGNSGEATVTVTREGLADDSVHAVRYEILLERTEEGTWRLRSARRLQRCQPERGHQGFSAQLCR
jgi:hypothetical protein